MAVEQIISALTLQLLFTLNTYYTLYVYYIVYCILVVEQIISALTTAATLTHSNASIPWAVWLFCNIYCLLSKTVFLSICICNITLFLRCITLYCNALPWDNISSFLCLTCYHKQTLSVTLNYHQTYWCISWWLIMHYALWLCVYVCVMHHKPTLSGTSNDDQTYCYH